MSILLPPYPYALWTVSRDGFADYSRFDSHNYAIVKEYRTPTTIYVKHPPTNQTHMVPIPPTIWEAGKLSGQNTDYAEAAIVHAQLLARPGMNHSRMVDADKLKEVASLPDTAATILMLRSRMWSINVSKEAQKSIYKLICDITDRIADPVGRAMALYDIFQPANPTVFNDGPPPESLHKLPRASQALYRAMAHTAMTIDPKSSPSRNMEAARRKLSLELFESLGVAPEPMLKARAIDRGFDLMTVGATIGWMRAVHQFGADDYIFYKANDHHNTKYIAPMLLRLEGIYGWKEIANPSLRKINEAYIKAAIDKMTDYKKRVLSRTKLPPV